MPDNITHLSRRTFLAAVPAVAALPAVAAAGAVQLSDAEAQIKARMLYHARELGRAMREMDGGDHRCSWSVRIWKDGTDGPVDLTEGRADA